MGKGSGLGALIALLGLGLILSSKKKRYNGDQIPAGYFRHVIEMREWPTERITSGLIMPTFPSYPQVTAGTRIDPRTPHYEEVLAEKYPEELEATREAYVATRGVLGLSETLAKPMPRSSRTR